MLQKLRLFRLFFYSLTATIFLALIKWILHEIGFEPIAQSSLLNSVISSVIFVIGFLLSATIADYKESEKIPSEFAAAIEDMYEDARAIHGSYPKFDLDSFKANLIDILDSFRDGTRVKRHNARLEIVDLHETFIAMEKAGVPANFIVKLKQQQGQLLRSLYRVNYIQKIKFIPSAFILARSIVALVIAMLLLTKVEPFYGSLVIGSMISFILIYMTLLIQVISVPFHTAGKTKDDVSLFLLREAKERLNRKAD